MFEPSDRSMLDQVLTLLHGKPVPPVPFFEFGFTATDRLALQEILALVKARVVHLTAKVDKPIPQTALKPHKKEGE